VCLPPSWVLPSAVTAVPLPSLLLAGGACGTSVRQSVTLYLKRYTRSTREREGFHSRSLNTGSDRSACQRRSWCLCTQSGVLPPAPLSSQGGRSMLKSYTDRQNPAAKADAAWGSAELPLLSSTC